LIGVPDPAETERASDRENHPTRVERRGQRYPAHSEIAVGPQPPRDLHGEPGLACTADTADSGHSRRTEKQGEFRAFTLSADEPREVRGQLITEELSVDRHTAPSARTSRCTDLSDSS
jgi:hypothetical protein